MGMTMGMGMGWDGRKSLKALILRAPLCGANKSYQSLASEILPRQILSQNTI